MLCVSPDPAGATGTVTYDSGSILIGTVSTGIQSDSFYTRLHANFPTGGGQVTVGGIQYTYTAYTAATRRFTGVTPNPLLNDMTTQDVIYYFPVESSSLPGSRFYMNDFLDWSDMRVLSRYPMEI
jgi:hypothetical protein